MSESRKGWVPPHSHCRVCGKSVPVKREFCSKQCEAEATRLERRNRRMSRIYLVVFVVLMVMLLLWSLTLGG